jgi:uridine kinase
LPLCRNLTPKFLKAIKSSAANIVKDDKYYQSLVDSQHTKYKDIDVFDCIKNNDVDLVEAYMKTGMNDMSVNIHSKTKPHFRSTKF